VYVNTVLLLPAGEEVVMVLPCNVSPCLVRTDDVTVNSTSVAERNDHTKALLKVGDNPEGCVQQ